MHVRKYLSIFLIGLVFAIAGCSSSTDSGIGDLEKSLDTDGDGIANEHDGDIDGDGKPNENDDDIDGDGILNKDDTDDDGDGTDDANDKTAEGPGDNSKSKKNCEDNGGTWDDVSNQCALRVANPEIEACIISGGLWEFSQCTEQEAANPCTSAKIIVPNEELPTGTKTKVKWKLQPEGCELTEERNKKIQVTAFNQYAKPDTETTGTPHVGKGHGQIHIPNNCNWDRTTTKKITYDFSALGTALGDPQANTSAYKQDVTHPVGQGENCDTPPIRCSTGGWKVTYPTCGGTEDSPCGEGVAYEAKVECTDPGYIAANELVTIQQLKKKNPHKDEIFSNKWMKIGSSPGGTIQLKLSCSRVPPNRDKVEGINKFYWRAHLEVVKDGKSFPIGTNQDVWLQCPISDG